MKILYILNVADKVNNFSEASMQAALELGFEFQIAGNWGYESDDDRKADEEKYGIRIHQVDFIRLPMDLRNIKAYNQIVKILKEESIDVIHCNTPIGGIVGRIAGKYCDIQTVIYQAHGFHFYKRAPLINRTIFKWAEMLMAHWTDAIITMNQEDYQAAQKFKLRNRGKVFYTPGVGIDCDIYKDVEVNREKIRSSLGISDTDVVCISMGDLIPRKNYGTAIEAIAKCDNKNIHYWICGQGPELDNLKELAKKQNIEDRIHFLGFRTDIKELLKAADIFLFTTLQEGMPRSMMEAMASGLPCIASKIRGNVDLLEAGMGGFLDDAKDVNGIAEHLRLLASDTILRDKMGRANLDRIREFDVGKVEAVIKNIYSEILGGGASSLS